MGSRFLVFLPRPRFPAIPEKPDMLDYWRMTDNWPDYCEQVGGEITRCW